MKCFLVEKNESSDVTGEITRGIVELPQDKLSEGEVLIRVRYSSLNYKDALAANGHVGVARKFPHVPGIDAAGVVEDGGDSTYTHGDEVLVTGYELGSGYWGGWSQFIRVPSDWVVPLPVGLDPLDAMTLGTAGFTAAQCVESLRMHGVASDDDGVVVTGATGGVGSLAVMLLSRQGYHVTAVTGKSEKHAWLRELGAAEVIGREEVNETSDRPLLKARWAGAVDTVGGNTLATLLKSLGHRGCVAACGLVGGDQLQVSVYPFLLRGVTLDGIDSAHCPGPARKNIWRLLSGDWALPNLDAIRTIVRLEDIEESIQTILAGRIAGRVVVEIPAEG